MGSVAGPDGGYYLTRPPEEVSLLEVVEGAEGALITGTWGSLSGEEAPNLRVPPWYAYC